MSFWGILGGAVIGVGAIAAAPFTGGGSLIGANSSEHYNSDISVSESEVKELLTLLDNQFNEEKFNNLLANTKQTILDNMIKPFGLAKVLFEDKEEKKIKKLDKMARKKYDDKINSEYYTSKKFAKNTAISNASEGLNMGKQQAFGLMLREFVSAIFDEAKDVFKNGFKNGLPDDGWFKNLAYRFSNISKKVLSKWKDFVVAFKDGAISGIFSNIITVVVNMFFKTLKNIVKIIREGFFSIMKAVKMVISPPKGMTLKEAGHEATKLLASGAIISLGIYFENYLPELPVFGSEINMVVMGLLTGLVSTIVIYFIDKMDLFGVVRKERHKFIMGNLSGMIESDMNYLNESFEKLGYST